MRIRIINAVTNRPFAGNPAAVCLLDTNRWPDQTWMQQVAAEVNLSNTAFAHSLPASVDADWALRWFTPAVEVDLCGHATLATAHASHSDGDKPDITYDTAVHGDRVHLTGHAITVLDGTLYHTAG